MKIEDWIMFLYSFLLTNVPYDRVIHFSFTQMPTAHIPESDLDGGFSGMRNVPVQYFRRVHIIRNGGKGKSLVAVVTGGQLLLAKTNGNIKYCTKIMDITKLDVNETEELIRVQTVEGCFQIKFLSDMHLEEFCGAVQQVGVDHDTSIAIDKKGSLRDQEFPSASKKKVEILPLTVPLPAYRIPVNRSTESRSSERSVESPLRISTSEHKTGGGPTKLTTARPSQPALSLSPSRTDASSIRPVNDQPFHVRNTQPRTVQIEIPTSNHTSRVLQVPSHCADSVKHLVSDMLSAHSLLDAVSAGSKYKYPTLPDPMGDHHVPSPVHKATSQSNSYSASRSSR